MKKTYLSFTLMISFLFSVLFVACVSTTKPGSVEVQRKQLMLISSQEVDRSSAEAYDVLKADGKKKTLLNQNSTQLERLQIISKRLIAHTQIFREEAPQWPWEVNLMNSPELNAFCMPSGKIMFYTGIIDKLQLTDDEIAAIMGHEIAHALREHGRERMSEIYIQQFGIEALLQLGGIDSKHKSTLNKVAQVAISLPHSRAHESEADALGLELMARGGYDPRAAVSLWKKMSAQGGSKPPELLSTHPSDEKRIQNIESLLPRVLPLFKSY